MADVAILSQMDPRWKNTQLGSSKMTIGSYGCLLTSMTMVANYYGASETPATLNDKMKAVGGYQDALIMPYLLPSALPGQGLIYRDFMNCEKSPAPMAEIDACLAQGKPVIVEVDYSPNGGLQNHWIVLYAKKGNDYLLRDPYPYPAQTGEMTLLTSRYKFGGKPEQIIQAVVYIDCSSVAPVSKPVVDLDKGVRASFPVYATADGLALRSDTVVADNTLIKRVALGAVLTVLESDAVTKTRLGVLNQWLPILDPADHNQGWAAAWYLANTPPGSMPAAGTMPAAGAVPVEGGQPVGATPVKPAALIVKTIDEGVALRTQPVISDATLVKRVPVNTELTCTEPFDPALAKVGVTYQWLQVKDVAGAAGYVAAWYVKAVNGLTTLGVKPVGAVGAFGVSVGDEIPPLIIRASVEGLALRRLPLITAETLLKRLRIDAELHVLEDPIAAEAKLGQMGEWFHVCDIEGQEGYVAAWYCVRQPDLALAEGQELPG